MSNDNTQRKPHKHADVIKAWADGAVIQWRRNAATPWYRLDENPEWYDSLEYRVQPEPRTFWINAYHDGRCMFAHETEAEADKLRTPDCSARIKAVEVFE